jgi:hypothetical protein
MMIVYFRLTGRGNKKHGHFYCRFVNVKPLSTNDDDAADYADDINNNDNNNTTLRVRKRE